MWTWGRDLGLEQVSRSAGRPDCGTRRPWSGGKEVRDVEAGAAAEQARHALLKQHPLNELGLGLVVRLNDVNELSLGELGLDLAGALLPFARWERRRIDEDRNAGSRQVSQNSVPAGRRAPHPGQTSSSDEHLGPRGLASSTTSSTSSTSRP